jgi:hypothetical protein
MHHDSLVHNILESRLQTGFQRAAGALQTEKKESRILQMRASGYLKKYARRT